MSSPVMKEMPYQIEKSQRMKPFWEGLNEEKLRTTKCSKCNEMHYPPNPVLCSNCFSQEIEWVELPLSGEIRTWTHVTAPPKGFDSNYTLVTVVIDELDKPVLGRYNGEKPKIGDQVEIMFEKIEDQSFFVFSKKE